MPTTDIPSDSTEGIGMGLLATLMEHPHTHSLEEIVSVPSTIERSMSPPRYAESRETFSLSGSSLDFALSETTSFS